MEISFSSFFDTESAGLAIFSSFQLDADYFERQILRSKAISTARRIIIFMDAYKWAEMLRKDVASSSLNRRYLVVPVRPRYGVFHPKLSVLISEKYGQIQCGSNNLTRAGCSSNLEILNSFRFDSETKNEESLRLTQDAFSFFKYACDDAEEQTSLIARKWLDEAPASAPWLGNPIPKNRIVKTELVHSYQGSLWSRLSREFELSPPNRIMVISPYYDHDVEMIRRVHQLWPRCKIEIVVQQKTTNLPISQLKGFKSFVTLSELRNSSRRLHAKLVAWESSRGSGCLVGSANFTTAAFDARNIETCLLFHDVDNSVKGIFKGKLTKSPITFSEFDPGLDTESEPSNSDSETMGITSALLNFSGDLYVYYWNRFESQPNKLQIALRIPGEQRPRALIDVPIEKNNTVCLTPPDKCLSDVHGTLIASLIAQFADKREESPPIWVIQEQKLTYEALVGGNSSTRSMVEETGNGLPELLEELGNKDGVAAVIEYLKHLNIRFFDGSEGSWGERKFNIRVHDPFSPDLKPDWLLKFQSNNTSLAEAIYEFVDRHEQQRLRKHAKRGNINGAENYLNILMSLVRLLYIFLVRAVVKQEQFIDRVVDYLKIATSGIDTSEDFSEGYLRNVYSNINHDSDYLQEVCDGLNFLDHLWGVLLIAQKVRYIPNEKSITCIPPKRPSECLPQIREKLRSIVQELHLKIPIKDQVLKALEEYNMFSSVELNEFESEMMI